MPFFDISKYLSRFAILACIVLPFATPMPAVIIRHDKNDEDARRIGERFNVAGRVIPDGSCTLVGETWAVTAAHVARSKQAGSKVEFGGKEYKVKRVIIHPEGKSEVPGDHPKSIWHLSNLQRRLQE